MKEVNDALLIEMQAKTVDLHRVSIIKRYAVNALENELRAESQPSEISRIKADLTNARKKWFDATTEYLKAEIDAAKLSRDSFAAEHRHETPEAYDINFGTRLNKEVVMAKARLQKHLENKA